MEKQPSGAGDASGSHDVQDCVLVAVTNDDQPGTPRRARSHLGDAGHLRALLIPTPPPPRGFDWVMLSTPAA
jgi:hypothetical protein